MNGKNNRKISQVETKMYLIYQPFPLFTYLKINWLKKHEILPVLSKEHYRAKAVYANVGILIPQKSFPAGIF